MKFAKRNLQCIFPCSYLSFIKSYIGPQSFPRVYNLPVNAGTTTSHGNLNMPSWYMPATKDFQL